MVRTGAWFSAGPARLSGKGWPGYDRIAGFGKRFARAAAGLTPPDAKIRLGGIIRMGIDARILLRIRQFL